jgi:hypothetical protein
MVCEAAALALRNLAVQCHVVNLCVVMRVICGVQEPALALRNLAVVNLCVL